MSPRLPPDDIGSGTPTRGDPRLGGGGDGSVVIRSALAWLSRRRATTDVMEFAGLADDVVEELLGADRPLS